MGKKVYILAFIVSAAFFHFYGANAQCNEKLVEKAITNSGMDALFIREFKIKQGDKKRRKKDKRAVSVSRYSVRLNKGIQYRFNIENDVQSQPRPYYSLEKETYYMQALIVLKIRKMLVVLIFFARMLDSIRYCFHF